MPSNNPTLLHVECGPGVLGPGEPVCMFCGKSAPWPKGDPCIGPVALRRALVVYREAMRGPASRLTVGERARVGFLILSILGDHWNPAIVAELDKLFEKASQ